MTEDFVFESSCNPNLQYWLIKVKIFNYNMMAIINYPNIDLTPSKIN